MAAIAIMRNVLLWLQSQNKQGLKDYAQLHVCIVSCESLICVESI